MPSRVVVVGACAAGLTAIEELRRGGFTGSIVAVGDEVHLPYDRPPLSKQILSGDWKPEQTFLRPDQLDKLDVDWRLNRQATSLDMGRQHVALSDGTEVGYDGLVIATGVTPRRLPHGHELVNVHTLRSVDDALELRASLLSARALAVVGAGFLGAEVAAVARAMGREVTLIDPLAAPMVRALGREVSSRFTALHEEHGVAVRCGIGVAGLEGANGAVSAVHLTDGSTIRADVVLVAIGCVPATEWLTGSGLSLTNGVDCDEFCQAAPGIVAAGDVASWLHPNVGRVRVEHRMNATEQAMFAARALVGNLVPFRPIPYFWSDQYDVKVQAYGFPSESASFLLVSEDVEGRRFAGVYETNGHVVGALTWNMPAAARKLRVLVAERSPVSAVDVDRLPAAAT